MRRVLAPVFFDPYAIGDNTKSVSEWGVDTAWPSEFNVRQSVENIGLENVDVVRVNFFTDEALNPDNTIGANSQALLTNQLSLAAQFAPGKPIAMTPSIGFDHTDPSYLDGDGNADPDALIALMKASIQYVEQQTGLDVIAIEPFNEPDLWPGQGTPEILNTIMTKMVADSFFDGVLIQGASTLASENAYFWYDRIRGPAMSGTTHLLGSGPDALASYAGFFPYVKSNGTDHSPDDVPYNPEVHSMAEMIVGADRGMEGGIFWAIVERPRALFVTTSDGNRLGYAEDLVNQSAAAVYRGLDGEIRGFAGGIERSGNPTQYQFTSTAGPVYFNGIGPINSYAALTKADQQTAVEIDTTAADAVPPLDGFRWKIINRASGGVLDLFGNHPDDGGNIQLWEDNGGLNQFWDVRQEHGTYNGFFRVDDYLYISSASSGRMAEVTDFSLDEGANVQQYGLDPDFVSRHWYVDQADEGYFYIRNANSNKYLTAESNSMFANVVQNSLMTGSEAERQQWEFVLSNPDPIGGLRTSQNNDGTFGSGSTFGNPTLDTNAPGSDPETDASMLFDGIDDYVQLETDVAGSDDLTVASWVKWNGGEAWQRIFDFGNSTEEYMFLSPSSGNGTLRFGISTAGYTNELSLDTAPLTVGQWHHVAITLGGNTATLYVDGVPVTAGQIPTNPTDFNPTMNFIGKSQFNDPLFHGQISDFAVYDFALSADQIAAMTIGTHAIENLRFTDRSSTSITIAWNDLDVENGYRVERSNDGVSWTLLGNAPQNITSWTEDNLTVGTEQYYRVRPWNEYGVGSWTSVMGGTPADSLPSPWASLDIGEVAGEGAAVNTAPGEWTVISGGTDIWNTADSFHFVSQQLVGNGEIIARVATEENTGTFAKAGVMIRESLAADSPQATVDLTPANGVEFIRRTASAANSASTIVAGATAPHWVRLVRRGDTLTAFSSADGSAWNEIGTDVIPMNDTIYVGLAVAGWNNSQLNTSTFTDVTLDFAPNTPPEITSNGGGETASLVVPENTTAVTDVQAIDDADAEGNGLSFHIAGGADEGLFAINPATGVLTFVSAPDFRNPTDADQNNIYEVRVVVTDSNSTSDAQDLSITVDSRLLAWWTMDETSGTAVSDGSGNGLHGTSVNGPAWVPGKFGNALSFDGE